jgi:cell division transport system permease protein
LFLIIVRTFKEALNNFLRNGWLSVASVSVLSLSIFSVSILFVVLAASGKLLENAQERLNVSIYFKSGTSEEKILEAKKDLESYVEVKSVEYVSKDQALENFKKNNADQPVIMQSLKELGDNPLLAYLSVRAVDSEKYDSIVSYANGALYKDDISRINYGKNKETINRFNNLVENARQAGMAVAIVFALISVLIVFNTIRMTIYTHRQEIEVMRLVGASNVYIRLPFIFEGFISGILATIISTGTLFVVLKSTSSFTAKIIPSDDLVAVYFQNLLWIVAIGLSLGSALGVLSGLIAIRKYLKI